MAASTSYTDLLIIGAGPAGLMAGCWASRYRVSARIIDDKPDRVATGHADGLTCRTLEIFDSFGIAQTVGAEASFDMQIRNWRPGKDGKLQRAQSLVAQKAGVSRFQMCMLHQGRIEELLGQVMNATKELSVERNVETLELKLDDDTHNPMAYPVEVKVRHKPVTAQASAERLSDKPETRTQQNGREGGIETIRAKYVIGADGAHSWTRRQVGLTMEGDTSAHIWGVLDVLPLTDFPDVRQTCVISSQHGNIYLVPREGKLVRLYIQLDEVVGINERFDRSKVTADKLLSTTQKILQPFKFECAYVDWWTVYQVGQRVADHFSSRNRVFLVGDAIHTHSPKVGQGMNVSMQDSYNLGWKICSVIKGVLKASALETYEKERRSVALDLIRVDQATVKYYVERDSGVEREDPQTFRNQLYSFLSGAAVDYTGSGLTSDRKSDAGSVHEGHQKAVNGSSPDPAGSNGHNFAKDIHLGRRLPSFKVINHANALPTHLASTLLSDGRWRLVVFAGDLRRTAQMDRIVRLGTALSSLSSIINRYPHPVAKSQTETQSAIQVITVISNPRDTTPLLDLPEVFHPFSNETGWDYNVVFSDEPDVYGNFEDAYGKYGVDREDGCLVLCRPDQHVALIGDLEAVQRLESFCAEVFEAQARGESNELAGHKSNGHIA